ncbi:uncharacterized protein LOC131317035 [Rhododendron vialii]|uniref:uncharacterized protein LOC131317035 n=1 Tax=Rhododendron vialii TaxID=182163 RepID=UPI00265F7389|nr:uncharacterized protein LOC131317035 [Rhododendron vialii]
MGDQTGAIGGEQGSPLVECFIPNEYESTSCIVMPTVRANQYEIRPGTLQMLPSFYGKPNEDPYDNLNQFMETSKIICIRDFDKDALKLLLFPFSLKDKAKQWLNSLPANSITSWTQMCEEFLKKYFSIGKTTLHRQEITGFTQHDGEQFHESWERFNDLLRTCPHHAIPKWQLVQSFYQGLMEPHRQLVDSSSGGTFLHKNVNDAWKLFENLSENSQHRASSLRHSRGAASSSSKQRGVYEVQPSNDLTHQVAALTKTLKELITSGQHPLPVGHHPPTFQEVCGICASPMHYITDCPSASQYPEFVQEQVSAAQGFSRPSYDPFSPTYNAGWKDHPNFSWRTQNQGSPSSLQQRSHNLSGFNQPKPNYPSKFNQMASQRAPQPFQQAPPPSQVPQPQRSPNFDETM